MKCPVLLLALLILGRATAAQPADAMSGLRQQLARATTDTARARLYFALSEAAEGDDSTLYFARQTLRLLTPPPAASGAERQRLQRLEASALNNIGVGLGTPAEALRYHQRAWHIRQQLHDWAGQAETSTNLGDCLNRTGDVRTAIEWLERGLRLAERHSEARPSMGQLLGQLANIYDEQGDPATALSYYQRALRLAEATGSARDIADQLRLISGALIRFDRTAEAETYAQGGLRLAEQAGAQEIAGHCELRLGVIRKRQGRWAEARDFLRRARERFDALNQDLNVGLAWLSLGQLEATSGRPDAALSAALSADTLLRATHQIGGEADVAKLLSELYQHRGANGFALTHYQRYILLRDSVQNIANQRVTLQQRLGYEYARRTAALRANQEKRQAVAQAEIRRQKLLRYATTGGAVALLLLALGLGQRFRFVRRANAIIQAARERAEREQRRSDELLLNILPADTAEELKATGHALARHHELVTVLFADVADFTQLAEHLSAQELVATLDTYFIRFDELCDDFGLEKIKTIGDAYMLTGGLRGESVAAAAAVVWCALAMQAASDELRHQRAATGLPILRWRVGIHSGSVAAGVVGTRKFAYDIWGNTVNTAARMEQSSRPEHINISSATYALVRSVFACTPRGALPVRHKADLEMYFVDRPIAEPAGA